MTGRLSFLALTFLPVQVVGRDALELTVEAAP